MVDATLGSCDLGIGGKLDRYVSHIRDSKSSRKALGHSSWSSTTVEDPRSALISSKLPTELCASVHDSSDDGGADGDNADDDEESIGRW